MLEKQTQKTRELSMLTVQRVLSNPLFRKI